ncbi:MAG: fibronectin type III domain-containing protein [Desulfobacterales bacterium]
MPNLQYVFCSLLNQFPPNLKKHHGTLKLGGSFLKRSAILSKRSLHPLLEFRWSSYLISQSFLTILAIIFTLNLVPCCFASQITVAWDENSETDIAGYKVHYGTTSGNYEYIVDVGNTTSCSISGLTEGTTYYLAATAYNTNNVESNISEELVHTVESVITNNPPTVSITSPANGASIDSGAIISFDGAASDNEDGDLSGDMVWASDLQGQIATGGSFTALLSDGTHTITAEVTDSGGSAASESTTITVGGGSDSSLTLSFNAFKIKGDKYAELTWSGANSDNVDVYRDGGSLITKANDGAFTHGPFSKGKPVTYQVCEAGTSICSNTVSVSW